MTISIDNQILESIKTYVLELSMDSSLSPKDLVRLTSDYWFEDFRDGLSKFDPEEGLSPEDFDPTWVLDRIEELVLEVIG